MPADNPLLLFELASEKAADNPRLFLVSGLVEFLSSDRYRFRR